MDIVILAAGLGTRLRPLTNKIPKALLPLANKPLLHWHLQKIDPLQHAVYINTAWMADQLKDFVQNHYPKVHLIDEGATPLGVAAGLINLVNHFQLKNDVLLLNADTYCEASINQLNVDLEARLAHLMLVNNPLHHEGDFGLENGWVRLTDSSKKRYTYAGLAKLSQQFLWQLKQQHQGRENFTATLKQAIAKNRVSGFKYRGIWFDIGTPERYQQARQRLG